MYADSIAIKGWKSRKLKRFYELGKSRGIPANMTSRLETRLDALGSAVEVTDMDVPGWDFHPLKGDRKGTWSVHVNGNWCVTFEFENGDAYVVDFEDYH